MPSTSSWHYDVSSTIIPKDLIKKTARAVIASLLQLKKTVNFVILFIFRCAVRMLLLLYLWISEDWHQCFRCLFHWLCYTYNIYQICFRCWQHVFKREKFFWFVNVIKSCKRLFGKSFVSFDVMPFFSKIRDLANQSVHDALRQGD